MAYKTSKNLLSSQSTYSRYYGDFRGVDFSSDHTMVHEQRLAYSVNMYRDYQSKQGVAIETVPGFRRRFLVLGHQDPIYGIHKFGSIALVHIGRFLFKWDYSAETTQAIVPTPNGVETTDTNCLYLAMNEQKSVSFIMQNHLYILDGRNYLVYDGTSVKDATENAYIPTTYIPGIEKDEDGTEHIIRVEHEQRNFLQPKFRERFVGDGSTTKFNLSERNLDSYAVVTVNGESIALTGENQEALFLESSGVVEFEEAPAEDAVIIVEVSSRVDFQEFTEDISVSPDKVDVSIVVDESEPKVKINITDSRVQPGETIKLLKCEFTNQSGGDSTKFKLTFENIVYKTDMVVDVPKETDGWIGGGNITGINDLECVVTDIVFAGTSGEKIVKICTLATVFDNRVFLSGNPNYPCHIFWCDIAKDTGLPDPTYFGVYSHQQDGVNTNAPVTGMLAVANALMVLKSDSEEDGCVYYHSPMQTENNVIPVVYPYEQGLHGIGCLGACVNFLDDPVFVSRMGLEAVGQLSVRYERAIEHRSSLVDVKLTECDLGNASVTEWNGFLVLLADGKVFMADNRQRYTDNIGNIQYEWYYLEGIGVYEGQYMEWRYATENKYPNDLTGYFIHPTKAGQIANPPMEDGTASVKPTQIHLDKDQDATTPEPTEYGFIVEDGVRYLLEMVGINNGPMIGGTFHPATVIREIDGNLWFGTDNGVVCSFNFDKRNEYGEIPPEYYEFDGRTIFCGCATKMDNCGIPHLTKDTVKKSTVIKTKSLLVSAAKIKVRTNKKPYEQVQRIGSATLDFNYLDFSDFSFETVDHTLFSIREKEKKWVEKQYFVYSDEYRKPFALYYIAFRYNVAGRYKD